MYLRIPPISSDSTAADTINIDVITFQYILLESYNRPLFNTVYLQYTKVDLSTALGTVDILVYIVTVIYMLTVCNRTPYDIYTGARVPAECHTLLSWPY